MTDESKSQTEEWIEKFKARYAYAYYSGRTLPQFAGVRGIPSAILLDPSGTVVWQGHPGTLTGDTIEQHLEGALPWALYDFPPEASKVAKALKDDDLGDALEEALELAAEGEFDRADEVVAAVEGQIKSRVGQVTEAYERGDFLKVEREGERLARSLKGLPQAEEIEALVEKVDDDDFAQDVIKVQEKLERIREDLDDLSKKRQADSLIDDLEKLRDEIPGSYAATQADELITEVRKLRGKLR